MPTILELFQNKDSFKYGTTYSEVKADTETLVEQETSGIRIKSLVEINNSLIYGNEAGRISLRSTPDLEKMKSNTGGEGGDGGLIGKGLSKITGGAVSSISDVRDKVNSTLGIPENLIPTKVSDKVIELRGKELTSADPITPDTFDNNGTGFGKFLKNSGGGNLKTIGKQALGNGIGFAKDKLRGALFGEAQGLGDAQSTKEPQVNYTNSKTGERYSDQKESVKNAKGDELLKKLKETKLDLSKVSPIYGVKRESSGNQQKGTFGIGKHPFSFDSANPKKGEKLPTFTAKDGEGYSDFIKDNDDKVTLAERGLRNSGDTIAMGDPYTTTVDTESGEVTVDGFSPVKDLVPFFIGRYKSKTYPMMAFRCSITGLTETSSPTWNSNNFIGNPYKYYIFETVERSVSFNLQVYCQNPLELANNWSKLSNLTKLSYPLIEDNMAHPNFTEFTLGDMYKNKVCIIEALTYTFPDNGTWETNVEGLLLPKFVDVAITLKFVENIEDGSVRGLYSYPKNLSDENDISSQHQIYENADRYIKYHTIDENGKTNEIAKKIYTDELAAGSKVGIKIKL